MKNAPKFAETMVSNLAIKSTQSITGKVKYLKDAVMVGETLIPMTAILVVANNTVFYTKFSNVGKIVHVEQKNGMVAYVLESGAVVTVVDPSAVQVMVQAVKVPCEEEEPEEAEEEEEDSDEEDSEEEEEEDSDEEDSEEEEEEEESEDEEEEEEEESEDEEEEEEEERNLKTKRKKKKKIPTKKTMMMMMKKKKMTMMILTSNSF